MESWTIRAARRTAWATATGVLVLTMSACGQDADGGEESPATTTGVSQGTSDGAQDRRVSERYISADDLPGEWRASDPPGAGFRQQVCGVDIEPAEPVDGGAIRYSQGSLGPFLAQHVRIHEDPSTPRAVVTELKGALPGCTSYETKGNRPDSPTVRFDVEPLTVAGLPDNGVAWRQTATTGSRVTTDMVLVADDEALVAFVSYRLQEPPEPQVLEDAVAAFTAKG